MAHHIYLFFKITEYKYNMSFDNVVGGKLKLKGLGDVKKDKKKRKRKEVPEDAEEKDAKKQKLEDGTSSPPSAPKPKKTAAEIAYEEKQRERVCLLNCNRFVLEKLFKLQPQATD